MPKLNLDIFGSDSNRAPEHSVPKNEDKERSHRQVRAAANAPVEVSQEKTKPAGSDAGPKFVSVGFHEEHLRVLDEAVMKLRRQGQWKASKSAIIRRLIDLHRDELDRIYLDGAKDT